MSGWQIMALKSGQMAYLTVTPAAMENVRTFLKAASLRRPRRRPLLLSARQRLLRRHRDARREVLKNDDAQRAVTAIGLLCLEYMHMSRKDPAMVEGTEYIMKSLPDTAATSIIGITPRK